METSRIDKIKKHFDQKSNYVLNECEEEKYLTFGLYTIIGYLDEGVQGSVFKAKSAIGRVFALKISDYNCYIETESKQATKRSIWWDEVSAMASLYHRNIVNIHSAGLASEDENERWMVAEGRASTSLSGESGEYAYILMDIVSCSLKKIFPPHDSSAESVIVAAISERYDSLVNDSIRALSECHDKLICHGDIHEGNIRFSEVDSHFVLMDFGLMQKVSHRPNTLTSSGQKLDKYKKDVNDLVLLLYTLLTRIEYRIERWRYSGLKKELEKLILPDETPKKVDYVKQRLSPYLRVKGWTLDLKQGKALIPSFRDGFIFDTKVRIPCSGTILLFRNARLIIDSKPFQRLRHVRQLGPTSYVFPGATHTRFEHTLGVYDLCCRYLERLTSLEVFRNEVDDISEAIRAAVAAALLHDVGHYPFSHWVEELGKYAKDLDLPDHEERVREIIDNSELKVILKEEWRISVESVCELISGKGKKTNNGVIGSILSSSLDCDKLDYLVRDSLHCGVRYGLGLDIDRLIGSLYINRKKETICLNLKGKASVMGLMYCRNTMYKEVYWHKTVRCYMGMFKRAFYEYSNLENFQGKRDRIFNMTDSHFIEEMFKALRRAKNPAIGLLDAFRGEHRSPYKIVYTYQDGDAGVDGQIDQLFRNILKSDHYQDFVRLSSIMTKVFKDELSLPPRPKNRTRKVELQNYDIIIEVTPNKDADMISRLDELKLFDEASDSVIENRAEVDVLKSLNGYLEQSRQVYICVSPWFAKSIKIALTDPQKEIACFKKILKQWNAVDS